MYSFVYLVYVKAGEMELVVLSGPDVRRIAAVISFIYLTLSEALLGAWAA